MKKSFKKFSCFASSLFILLIHLPFVFAKSIPHAKPQPANTVSANAASNALNTLKANYPNTEINIYDSLQLDDMDLSEQAYQDALKGYFKLRSMGRLSNDSIISIIDFSLSSTKKRLFVIDIKNCKVLFNTYVAHGRNSGAEFARRFSNSPSSRESSLGFYVTGDTYNGDHGYSLRLEGEEKGFNSNAYRRAIVMHSADYVNEDYINENGILGRSYGCPAIPEDNYKSIIDEIKNGSCLFLYGPSKYYLAHSKFLKQAS
jgi:hypothetical protein